MISTHCGKKLSPLDYVLEYRNGRLVSRGTNSLVARFQCKVCKRIFEQRKRQPKPKE